MEQVVSFLENHYNEKIEMKKLADKLQTNPCSLCRQFKRETGKTPTVYLNHYRISQAAIMIANQDTSLLDISLDCGFFSYTFFVENFKRYLDCTPSQYRNMKIRQKEQI